MVLTVEPMSYTKRATLWEILLLLIIFAIGAWGYSHFFAYNLSESVYQSLMSMASVSSPPIENDTQRNFVTLYTFVAVVAFFSVIAANAIRAVSDTNAWWDFVVRHK